MLLWALGVGNIINAQGFIAIKKNATGTKTTELHFVQAPNFEFKGQVPTGLHETNDNFKFDFVDWNNDGVEDFCAVKMNQTGTNTTELHVFSGIDFKTKLVESGTALHATDASFDFHIGDWNNDGQKDLIALSKTGATGTEVHVLDGKNLNSFILHSSTALNSTGPTFEFDIHDWNNDSQLDLIVFSKQSTGSHTTELHVFNGKDLKQALLHSPTGLHETDNTFSLSLTDWNGDGQKDFVAIKKSKTGSNSTEIHVFDGRNLSNAILHSPTKLHETGSNFAFYSFGTK